MGDKTGIEWTDATWNPTGVPFHFKQWGEWVQEGQAPADAVLPSPCRWDEATGSYHLGKRKAGREVDGRTWDEWPT